MGFLDRRTQLAAERLQPDYAQVSGREIRLPSDAVCDHVLENVNRLGRGDDDVAPVVGSAT